MSIAPLNRATLTAVFDRPRGAFESTDFSISRFIVPYLCDFDGWAVYMDCDMLCMGDVAELAGYMSLMDKYGVAVRCVQHDYVPVAETKFRNQQQNSYTRKNWSSLMLFNNSMCRKLTPEYVNTAPGMSLHQFSWAHDDKVRDLPKCWNYLVGEENQTKKVPKMVHFTTGGPWFDEYKDVEFAQEWRDELAHMNGLPL